MRATFSPGFFKSDTQEFLPANTVAANAPLPVNYSKSRYDSIDGFLQHTDFPVFKEQFTASIDQLGQFMLDHAQAVQPPITPARVDQIRNDLATLKTRLFDHDQNFYSSHTPIVYQSGKEYFGYIAALVADDKCRFMHV